MRWSWHTARLSINKLVIPETVFFFFSNTNWQIKLKQKQKNINWIIIIIIYADESSFP